MIDEELREKAKRSLQERLVAIVVRNCVTELWDPRWLVYMTNLSDRQSMLKVHGIEACFEYLEHELLDEWREYKLYSLMIGTQPAKVLIMTCPSTRDKHLLTVPPSTTGAREGITWVNQGLDPESFVKET